ncbi:MAG: hypothetical protein ACLPN1_18555 [Dissulfurispiraceae bacterium]|jgi:hypothetical protein
MKKCLFFFFLCLTFLVTIPVEAFDVKGLEPVPPYGIFSTFSAESLPQNEVGTSLELEREEKPDLFRTTLKGAFGLHDRLQVMFDLPYVSGNDAGGNGLEDINFGIQHRLLDETKYLPAFAYLLTIAAPSSNAEISTKGSEGGGLLFTKKLGPFKGSLNFIYIVPGNSELHKEYDVNFGAEIAVTHNSKILGELVTQKDFYKGKLDLIEWRLGYRVAATDNIFTTIGAGWDTKDRTPEFRLLFSVSVILPLQKPKIQKVYED